DVETPSDDFGNTVTYEASARFQVIPGLEVAAGYHKTREFSAGLRFALGRSTVYSYYQPTSGQEKWTGGFQSTVFPRKSFIYPSSTLRVKLDNRLSEEGNPGGFFQKPEPSFLSVLERIEKAS